MENNDQRNNLINGSAPQSNELNEPESITGEGSQDFVQENEIIKEERDTNTVVNEANLKEENDIKEDVKPNVIKNNVGKNTASAIKIFAGLVTIVAIALGFVAGNFASKNDELEKEISQLEERLETLQEQNDELEVQNNELENGASAQLVEIKNAFESQDWESVVEKAAVLHEQYNGSAEDKEAQELAKQAQTKIDEAAKAAAEEKAKGYETGITYDQLARTPDNYIGDKVKFYGKVIQVIESDSDIQIRLAVNDNYDTILFGQYDSSIVSSRVLEDDHITVYGTSVGTITYESTMGGNITIPGVYIEKIDQ